MHRLRPAFARTPEALAETLGLSPAHARQWRIQHALLGKLKEIVKRGQITHTEIARRAGTSRTRVTAILNDRLDSVSTDLLIRMLGALGYEVRVSVSRMDTAA